MNQLAEISHVSDWSSFFIIMCLAVSNEPHHIKRTVVIFVILINCIVICASMVG